MIAWGAVVGIGCEEGEVRLVSTYGTNSGPIIGSGISIEVVLTSVLPVILSVSGGTGPVWLAEFSSVVICF